MLRPIARQRLFAPASTALAKSAIVAPRAPLAWRALSSFPIASVSFWKSLVPKPFRRAPNPYRRKRNRVAEFQGWITKEWNPATFFIIIFLLIGSMSINMISLKKGFETYMRQSETRIGLLREVVEKLQRGEEVDVEKVLGTGVPEREAEWEELLNTIEREDVARRQKRKQAESAPSLKLPKEEPVKPATQPEPSVATSRDFF